MAGRDSLKVAMAVRVRRGEPELIGRRLMAGPVSLKHCISVRIGATEPSNAGIAQRYNRSHKCLGSRFADCETRQQGGANGLHGAMKLDYETGSRVLACRAGDLGSNPDARSTLKGRRR